MSSNSPCAACKFQRRKCTPECIFAPYFPPEDPQKFVKVHKVFGGSNVSKILSDLNPAQRDEAARSLAFEAECRLQDPIYGCVGYITKLQQRLKQLHFDLSNAKEELATYIGPSALLPSLPQHPAYNNNGQMLYSNNVTPQQQSMGNPPSALPYTNMIGAPTTTVVYGAGTCQQQQSQMMIGGDVNQASSNSASALPYTNLMLSGCLGAVVAPSSQAVLIREQQEQLQHGVVDPIMQQYGGHVVMAATTTVDHGQHDDQLLRNYEQQQDYLVFKSSGGEDQYELHPAEAAAGSFIQMAPAAADEYEIGAAGPSLALGVNYDQNPYNSQIQDQQQQRDDDDAQQHHIAFQTQLLLQQHSDNHVLQTHQRITESGEGRSADPAASC